jgi:CDP-glucose 4,6-dehydratase
MDKDYSSVMEISVGQRLRELPGPILVTGHTGFKGTWLTYLLEYLNVPVVGYSLPPEKDSLYLRAQRLGVIPETFSDIRDHQALEEFIGLHKPSSIIHMAAQPLVLKSYENPKETFDVNVMGTVNLLDTAFKENSVRAIIVVTTDKVYRNDDSRRSFIETDPLEGKDPYSASKVGTESVVSAWQHISLISGGPAVVSVRAGNVIGGGDFAVNRILPDLIRGVINKQSVEIRNPENVRPWQHVLDPLVGYIQAMNSALEGNDLRSLNFGPIERSLSVKDLVEISRRCFPDLKTHEPPTNPKSGSLESRSIELSSLLSNSELGWKPVWDQETSVYRTLRWWEHHLKLGQPAQALCKNDLEEFFAESVGVNVG